MSLCLKKGYRQLSREPGLSYFNYGTNEFINLQPNGEEINFHLKLHFQPLQKNSSKEFIFICSSSSPFSL